MSDEKITVTASDLPTSYVPYTNDDMDAIYISSTIATNCALCEEEIEVSMFSTTYGVICPRCKRVWKKFLKMYDDGSNYSGGVEN